jgi:hypothetical protein
MPIYRPRGGGKRRGELGLGSAGTCDPNIPNVKRKDFCKITCREERELTGQQLMEVVTVSRRQQHLRPDLPP